MPTQPYSTKILLLFLFINCVIGQLNLSNRALEAYQRAEQNARKRKNPACSQFHLARALFDEEGSFGQRLLKKAMTPSSGSLSAMKARQGVFAVLVQIGKKISNLPKQTPAPEQLGQTYELKAVLKAADKEREESGDTHIGLDHLINASVRDRDVAAAIKASKVVSSKKIIRQVNKVRQSRGKANAKSKTNSRSRTRSGFDRSSSTTEERKTSSSSGPNADEEFFALESYAYDLVSMAEEGSLDPIVGRDVEIRRVVQVLSRKKKNNPVLVGEPGVGKTALVEGLAHRIVKGDVPTPLLGARLFVLDLAALVAGASARGQFEARLKAVIAEAESAEKVILFIDEVHGLIGGGGSGSMDAANLLKPALARGNLRVIGATTIAEYRKYIEKDKAFERRFQKVQVDEPDVEATIAILRGLRERYEVHHRVRILDASLVAAASLADRYIGERFNPDKAIDLIDEACAKVRVQLDSQPEELDELERRYVQLAVEQTALRRDVERSANGSTFGTFASWFGVENDDTGLSPSAKRLAIVDESLASMREELQDLRSRLEEEKERMKSLHEIQQRIDDLNSDISSLESATNVDLDEVSRLLHTVKPQLELKRAEIVREIEEYRQRQEEAVLLTDVIAPEHIAEVVSATTRIPVSRLSASERSRVLTLSERLHRRIVGQDAAVQAVSQAVLRSRAGLKSENQPGGSFLFLGPTGVGKTELAKALAEQLFDSEDAIVRLDMSEYVEKHSVARMIGSPPGYIGHDEGGQLTEAVRRKPYSIVLLDEVEKAHPVVFNTFLQVFDEGRLTDGKGQTVDFSNTYIIMTSNLGSHHLTDTLADGNESEFERAKEKVMGVVQNHFRPEFLNRLDDIIVFSQLSRRQLTEITRLLVHNFDDRMGTRANLTVTSRGIDTIVEQAYEPRYGARPLRRYIEHVLGSEIAKAIMEYGSIGGATSRGIQPGQYPNVIVDGDVDGSLDITIDIIQPEKKNAKKNETCTSEDCPQEDDLLPPNWVSYRDDASGKQVFYNKVTKEMSWKRPSISGSTGG
eukprot:g4132.t1